MGRAVLVLGLCAATPAHAYDPANDWQTIHAPHFRVHYDAGHYDLALHVARSAEHALGELTRRLGWAPSATVDIVLSDDQDFAQGFAQAVPYNLIGLNAAAPREADELADYDDWIYLLVAHEVTHVVHLDTVRGIPSVVNSVFGRVLAPNTVQPRWVVEGMAVHFETALTSVGRARNSYVDMVMRTAVLEDELMDLGEVSGAPWAWPQGNVAYFYGGRFVHYLAQRFGEDALRRISYDYAGYLVPWSINLTADRVLDRTYPELYAEFLADLRRRYLRQKYSIETLGRMEGERITFHGQNVSPPRVGPEGTIYYVDASVSEHPVLRALPPAGGGDAREVRWAQSNSRLAIEPGGTTAILSQLEIHETYLVYEDLFRVDLTDGSLQQLTSGARASAPDVTADGTRLAFVQRDGFHSVLRAAPIDDLAAAETVVDFGADTQVYSPRFSPDGQQIVFAAHVGGQRDLYVIDLDSRDPRRLTFDRALDGGAVFTPDGSHILYHSDRDGVFNLYALPTGGGELRQVTRLLGGAFHPEPSAAGDWLVYRSYGPTGFDLARLELGSPQSWPVAGAVPEGASEIEPPSRATTTVYPSRDYTPWPSLLPRAWIPITSVDTQGSTIGVGVTGTDAVERHRYTAQLWWGVSSEFPGLFLRYDNASFRPGFHVELSRRLAFAAAPFVRNDQPSAVEEEVWTARLGTRWPLLTRRDYRVSLGTEYELAFRDNREPFTIAPDDTAPSFPDEGRFAALKLDIAFSNAQRYANSISSEEGGRYQFSLRIEDPYLGSEYSSLSGSVSAIQYVENPFIDRHVLALRAFAGYGKSSYRKRKLFSISGLPQRDIVLDMLAGRFSTAGTGLRGFDTRPFAGDAIVNATAEYRFVLWDFESGIDTLPIYFRALSGAAFFDGAMVADEPADLADADHLHYSVGGELRMSMVLGYVIPVILRFGYGHGLGDDSDVHNWFLVLGNVF